jgi:hypothetical protein
MAIWSARRRFARKTRADESPTAPNIDLARRDGLAGLLCGTMPWRCEENDRRDGNPERGDRDA